MRLFASLAAVIILLGGCTAQDQPSPTTTETSSDAQPTTAPVVTGRWTGSATIVVTWVKQRKLPVQLEIAADGSVSGTVGDATLDDARIASGRGSLQRSLGWGRDYRIHGQLEGDLIKDEGVRRDSVDIVFDQTNATTLAGGLTSSGTEFGGKESMKLAAGTMRLRRAD